MFVIVELEVQNCSECPFYQYEAYSESIYICTKTKNEVNPIGVTTDCPYIESTINKLRTK